MKNSIIVIILSLFLTNIFGALVVPYWAYALILTPFLILEFKKNGIFKPYIFIMFVGLTASIISCYYYRDQDIYLTFKTTLPFYFILFYFLLKSLNPTLKEIERAMVILVILLCTSYIVQFLVYPFQIFIKNAIDSPLVVDVRIRLAGQGLASLGYFYGLNRFIKDSKNKSALLLSIICFSVIFLMGFRTMLVMIAIFSLFLVIKIIGFKWKLAIYGFLIVGLFITAIQIPVFANKVDQMISRQKTDNLGNKDYIRVIQFNYFTTQHFKSPIEFFFGSGMPATNENNSGPYESDYGHTMENLFAEGINYSDFGLLSSSWMIGIPTVLIMIIYAFRAYFIKLESDHYYLGVWFLYLVAISFTTYEFCRDGNFIIQAIALYMIEKAHSIYLKKKILNLL